MAMLDNCLGRLEREEITLEEGVRQLHARLEGQPEEAVAGVRREVAEAAEAGRLDEITRRALERALTAIEESSSDPTLAPDQLDDEEDDDATAIAHPPSTGGADDDDEDDGDATVIAPPRTSPADPDSTVIAPGGRDPNTDDDDEKTVIAYPDEEADDEAATVINTEGFTGSQTGGSGQTTGFNTTGYNTTTDGTTNTSQRSWDVGGDGSGGIKLGPGVVIKDRFVLDKVLGTGGMGKVFAARDLIKVEAQDKNPNLAMKVLTEDFGQHPEAFIALQREASRQQKLAHPNIATVYDFDRITRESNQVFITMEMMVGQPLDRYIKKVVRPKGGLPFAEAYDITSQLGAALSYAHQRSIVHSDFKPGNAFFCDDGVHKTLDFGIARAVKAGDHDDESDEQKTVFDAQDLGALTPAYASLEMLQGKEPSFQDDIYALACVAYELLTGYHPFGKKSAQKAKDAGMVPAPVKGLTKRQFKGLLRGLAFEREKRSPDVETFLEEFEGKANWHKNPYVLGSAFAVVLAIASAVPVMNYFEQRQIDGLISAIQTEETSSIERAIADLRELGGAARTEVADASRDVLQPYFRANIEEAVSLEDGRYDFDTADNELARARFLYPDSATVDALADDLQLLRSRRLNELNQMLTEALSRDRLLPDQGDADTPHVGAILDMIAAIDPEHGLLEDPRVPDAFANLAQEQLNIGDIERAETFLATGLERAPDDIDLLNARDRMEAATTAAQRRERVAELIDRFEEESNGLTNWGDLVASSATIVELDRLAPDDVALDFIREQATPVLDRQVTAWLEDNDTGALQTLAAEHAPLLGALDRHDLLVRAELALDDGNGGTELVAASRERLDELLADPRLDRAWEADVRLELGRLAALDDEPAHTEARDRLAGLYVARADELTDGDRFDAARNLLARSEGLGLDQPALAERRETLAEALESFRKEREEAVTEAHILGLQETLLVETRALELEAAEETMAELGEFLDDDEPFMIFTAADAMAAAYATVAADRAGNGDHREAQRLAERGLEHAPDNFNLQAAREDYLVEANTSELNTLFRDSDHFDTPDAQRMVNEIRTANPARYQELEREYVRILSERAIDLAEEDRESGERLATRAANVFPASNDLARLRDDLAPPPWPEGRAARAALAAGRLHEAQDMLERAQQDFDNHPEVRDFATDLENRLERARTAYANHHEAADAEDFQAAREYLAEARQTWTDNPDYGEAIADLSERIAQHRWRQSAVLRAGQDIRALRDAAGVSGAEAATEEWDPVETNRPCTEDLAGHGRRARAICHDLLHHRVRSPLLVVVPGDEQRDPFAISKYEISHEEWNKYCFFSGRCEVDEEVGGDRPVTGLSYEAIVEYTDWLSERTGQPYRLPTEDEWEYAAYAQGQQPPRDYNCRVRMGNQILKGDDLVDVSSGHHNGWGLQNFIGNAQELVLTNGDTLVARGGSYRDPHSECNIDFSRTLPNGPDGATGFRVVLERLHELD